MIAWLIDAQAREIKSLALPDHAHERMMTLSKAIGGYLAAAWIWPSGDVLYIDEDGHDWPDAFALTAPIDGGIHRVCFGSGVIVGAEIEDKHAPDGWTIADPTITADELRQRVRFFRRDD